MGNHANIPSLEEHFRHRSHMVPLSLRSLSDSVSSRLLRRTPLVSLLNLVKSKVAHLTISASSGGSDWFMKWIAIPISQEGERGGMMVKINENFSRRSLTHLRLWKKERLYVNLGRDHSLQSQTSDPIRAQRYWRAKHWSLKCCHILHIS